MREQLAVFNAEGAENPVLSLMFHSNIFCNSVFAAAILPADYRQPRGQVEMRVPFFSFRKSF